MRTPASARNAAGVLRAGVSYTDAWPIFAMLYTLYGVSEEHPELWRRYLAVLLDGRHATAMHKMRAVVEHPLAFFHRDHRIVYLACLCGLGAIAALLLYIRDETGRIPHAYFGWTEGNPLAYLLKFLAFGEGDTAPVTREVLRQSETDPLRRPRIHLG